MDWNGGSVLNVDYKICSRQTDRQTTRSEVKVKFCKYMIPLPSGGKNY
jgi:hypothetical protein